MYIIIPPNQDSHTSTPNSHVEELTRKGQRRCLQRECELPQRTSPLGDSHKIKPLQQETNTEYNEIASRIIDDEFLKDLWRTHKRSYSFKNLLDLLSGKFNL